MNNKAEPTKTSKSNTQIKKVVKLPKELSQLIVDTKRYKEKTSSTTILDQLRYHAA